VAELGISCEACHGPAQRHVEAQKSAAGLKKKVQPGEIVHPKKLAAERSAQVCGFCHSMKWIKSADWRENGFEFRPGDDLEQTTPIIRPSRIDAIPGLRDYLARNPDLLQDFFWPDGMIRVSGREFNSLIESPCYKGGKFSCVSCHSLHEGEREGQLAAKAKGNSACVQCHEQYKESAALVAHTHHQPSSSGSECYNCHMPHTTYGILKAIRSHQISSPKVSDDLRVGRPNACNLCHIDRTLDWTATQLKQWYGQENVELTADQKGISRIVDLALSGDAGQRVLAAWHLSWAPALEASTTTNWIFSILGQLLDDPYAAVRCGAERSFRRLGKQVPDGYDYSLDPRSREPVREKLWNSLQATSVPSDRVNALLLLDGKGQPDRPRFDALVSQRNERPVRLRE
jgi:predicted CXXCH cytochrome family protein